MNEQTMFDLDSIFIVNPSDMSNGNTKQTCVAQRENPKILSLFLKINLFMLNILIKLKKLINIQSV